MSETQVIEALAVEAAELASPDERVCDSCGAVVDAEDVFCGGCGRPIPEAEGASIVGTSAGIHGFRCDSCGAVMTFSATQQKLECAFCGSQRLTEAPRALRVLPRRLVPFRVESDDVPRRFRAWLGMSIWRPGDLRDNAAVEDLRGVFVPHWLFTCDVHTCWTADHDAVPPGRRGEWAPATGESSASYGGLLVPASGALTQVEAEGLVPYDFDEALAFTEGSRGDIPAEEFAVPRRTARAVASSRLIAREHERCGELVPGTRHRNLRVSPLVENMQSIPVLLPVWILAYRYHDKLYRFLVNGQTGEIKGTAPLSALRIGGAIALVAAIITLIFWLIAR